MKTLINFPVVIIASFILGLLLINHVAVSYLTTVFWVFGFKSGKSFMVLVDKEIYRLYLGVIAYVDLVLED